MLELADIFREYGPAYQAKYGDRMLPSHKKALDDILCCRTKAMGGHVYYCDACEDSLYAYHSCGNRHGPPLPIPPRIGEGARAMSST
jgi:hypothetical protein